MRMHTSVLEVKPILGHLMITTFANGFLIMHHISIHITMEEEEEEEIRKACGALPTSFICF
jgi:hypothetical protein